MRNAGSLREDADLRAEIVESLRGEAELDAADINVYVASGEIILLGTVPTFTSEQCALEIAELAAGARMVVSQLRISAAGAADSTNERRGREMAARRAWSGTDPLSPGWQ